MADRKQTPDILGDLLGGAPRPANTSIPVSQHTSKPVKQHTVKPVSQKASKPKQPADKDSSPEKARQKATYYLSPEALQALDEAWLSLRSLTKARAQISKSLIVEQAILLVVEELKSKGSQSLLAKAVFNDT